VILLDHVRCAAFELPFSDDEAGEPFGCRPAGLLPPGKENAGVGTAGDVATPPPPTTAELLAVLEAEGSVSHSRGTWFWLSESYPAAAVGLRSAGPEAVTVVVEHPHGSGGASPGEARAEALGTVERATAQIYLHPGAIYMHDGLTYRVRALDWDAGRAIVHPTEPASYTRAVSRVDVRPLRVDAERSAPGATVGCGEVEVTARVTGFREIRFHTHETLGWGQLDLPERRLRTGAYWFTLDDDTVESLRSIGRWREEDSTARGPNWSRQRDMARQRDGYRCRVCNVPERPGRQHDVHHIRPFAEFGYQRGANDAYLNANDLDNLITLCPRCHRLAERVLGLHGGLSGVGHALRHVSALHLMCDHRDIDVATTTHAPWSGRPTVVIHESVAAGVGFGSTLYELHEEIVADAAALIEGCPCSHGCPSCVGPVVEHGRDDKAHALTVLQAIGA
jgi:DEAD/DEAH box helicase domain-containing protein